MDLREGLNAISDVIVNRPPPLREFDQIYMKAADMLIQADHIARWTADKTLVFIGDGDALGLCLVHLHEQGHLQQGPASIHILDFDERVVNSVHRFAEQNGYGDRIDATLYNVAESLPAQFLNKFDGFYTNPPFGGANGGASVKAFLRRGIEATHETSVCCAVIADYDELPWCVDVLHTTQKTLLENGFAIAEMIPRFHKYHLPDEPELTSCSLVARASPSIGRKTAGSSEGLEPDIRKNFYGRGAALKIRYIRDLTNGGKMATRDHLAEPFAEEAQE